MSIRDKLFKIAEEVSESLNRRQLLLVGRLGNGLCRVNDSTIRKRHLLENGWLGFA
jgi:hypothetical protein